jgi:hypothetical protein
MPQEDTDLRLTRLLDLGKNDTISVWCPGCGVTTEYGYGGLQRHHRIPSTTLVFDLQFWLRCRQCNCRDGFRITIWDGRSRGDRTKDRNERVILEGDPPRYEAPINLPPRQVR